MNNTRYRRKAGSVYSLNDHRVWCPQYRRQVLGGEIAADLRSLFMNRNRHLSLSLRDAGFGLFRQMLEYKAESAGIQVIAVNPSYTTQVCSGFGRVVPKGLSVRVHACPDCGLVLDRDVNAARNILTLALANPLGRSAQPVTWAVAPGVG